ncbi:MAG: hypothetical protein AAGM67_21010, partial [Bacteroidota bacterium]
ATHIKAGVCLAEGFEPLHGGLFTGKYLGRIHWRHGTNPEIAQKGAHRIVGEARRSRNFVSIRQVSSGLEGGRMRMAIVDQYCRGITISNLITNANEFFGFV